MKPITLLTSCRIALAAIALMLPTGLALGQASVPTQNNDNARTGANLLETTLTPANVTVAKFGKLFTCTLNANVNGQVLYVPGVAAGGAIRNVIYASTSNNSNGSASGLYAFDADTGALIWNKPLATSAQWTTATPVIDTANNIIYVVMKIANDQGPNLLLAFDIATGALKPGGIAKIYANIAGTGDGSAGGRVRFNNTQANERPGLLLLNGDVYVAYAHNSDSFPYHGWVMGFHYNGATFPRTATFCTTPNGGEGGIWMAGKGLAADSNGYIYCSVGNGTFDIPSGGKDYGMCYLKLHTPDLTVADYFAPNDEKSNSDADLDTGGGGVLGIPNTTMIFGGGTKFGTAFLMNTSNMNSTNMGQFTPGGPDKVVNRLNSISGTDSVGQNAVVWDAGTSKYIYLWPSGNNLEQFQYLTSANAISPNGVYKQTTGLTGGGSLTVTANGSNGGILWAAGNNGILHAFNAADVSQTELWNSSMNSSRDSLGSVGHFQFPTAVNGKVYVPTGNGKIVVYGLLP